MSMIGFFILFLRGGTSRGPYVHRDELPSDLDTLSRVMIAAIGSGYALNIDGVPGTAAPILLNFMDVVGSSTGSLLPTGQAVDVDVIDGIEITSIDVAMPMAIALAESFGEHTPDRYR